MQDLKPMTSQSLIICISTLSLSQRHNPHHFLIPACCVSILHCSTQFQIASSVHAVSSQCYFICNLYHYRKRILSHSCSGSIQLATAELSRRKSIQQHRRFSIIKTALTAAILHFVHLHHVVNAFYYLSLT